MRLSKDFNEAAREAYYQCLSSWCAGGKLELINSENQVLATSEFPKDVAIATCDGFNYQGMSEAEVQKVGDPVAFKVISNDGRLILEGSVGTKDEDMIISEKDSRLFPGMRLDIEEFNYTKS